MFILAFTFYSYITTDERGVTYHVNLCDAADACEDGVSVCEEGRQTKTSIASFRNQLIMADGTTRNFLAVKYNCFSLFLICLVETFCAF